MNLSRGPRCHQISRHFQSCFPLLPATRIAFSLVIMLLLSAVATTAEPSSESGNNSIEGRVVNSAGSGVEGVMVSAVDHPALD